MVRLARPNFERKYPSKGGSLRALRWFWSNFWSTGSNKHREQTAAPKRSRNWRFRRSPVLCRKDTAENVSDGEDAKSLDKLNATHQSEGAVKNGKEFCQTLHPEFLDRTFCKQTNEIRTTKYTILSFVPKNLFEQFHRWANFYFLLLIVLNWLPIINAFAKEVCMIPLLIVLGVLGIKDLIEDVQRHHMDTRINSQLVETFCQRIRGEHKVRTLAPPHVLQNETYTHNNDQLMQIKKLHDIYAKNKIRTTKYTLLSFIPKNLFEQFHRFANCYFVFIILLNFVPAIEAVQPFLSMAPVILILLVQAFKDSIEDYGRHKNDREINSAPAEVYSSSDNKYHQVKWSQLQVGDIVRVLCNRVIPADVLLLHSSDADGLCYIETSNIDGESNLKQRMVVKRHWGDLSSNEFHPEEFKSIIECQTPNSEIYKFHGNIIPPTGEDKIPVNNSNLLLRGCVIRNTDYVEGIVIYAGHETKAMLNNNGPRYKRSKLERRMNTDVVYCVIMLVVMCLIGSVGNGIWASNMNRIPVAELFIPNDANGEQLNAALSGFYMFWTMVILLQVLIPISLYVSIELVKWAQVYMINNDIDLYHAETNTPMQCRALNIPEDLGQIQYVFSDKTGTLTENQMVFRRCTVGGVDYPHAANAARIENSEPTPAYIHPDATKQHAQSGLHRDDSVRQSYKRPHSGSIRPHLRKRIQSAHNKPQDGGDGNDTVDGAKVTFSGSMSAPNSPMLQRKNKAQMSTRRPAAHHRRNISSVSAREVLTTIASEDRPAAEASVPMNEPDDEGVDEDLETDVTPDPVLYGELKSIVKSRTVDADLTVNKTRIMDFFVNLAICNTVVLSSDHAKAQTAKSGVLSAPSGDNFRSLTSSISTPSDSGTPIKDKMSNGNFYQNGNTNNSANIGADVEESGDFEEQDLSKIRYEAESPDEAALVYAAHAYGCVLSHRSSYQGKETVTVTLPNNGGKMEFEVLHKLPFDSARKRMSVIVRDPRTKEVILYCKGADSAILSQLASTPDDNVHFDLEPGDGDIAMKPSNSGVVIDATKKYLDAYARSGLRTLCISKKVISEAEYRDFVISQNEAEQSLDNRDQLLMNNCLKMETNLELLGATGIEDRLQEGVPETIEALRQAGIQVWVVTGDKQETAINIGYSCRLIHQRDEVITLNAETKEAFEELLDLHVKDQDRKRGIQAEPQQQSSILPFDVSFILPNTTTYPTIDDKDMPALVLVIDGKTLGFALQKDIQKKFVQLARRCRSVLCCRATPIQKGEVVKLIRDELHVMTLAIGDGANDVSMIQVADVGIGLSGQEGMQAVMSSDYALAQFRFLKKLLLVHGHWNYARLASMVLYFFYKNAAFVFLIFWYQILCGFSGSNMIEQYYLLFFSLFFTSVPPLINGVLDRDLTEETLMRKPALYMQGIKDELYVNRSFWINILDAIYQSVIIFFFLYLAYYDSNVGIIEWGTPVTTAALFTQLIHLGIETKSWTWIHWVAQLGSILFFFAFALIYNIVCPACSPPSNPYFVMQTVIQTGNFWFTILLCIAVALFPRYFIRAIQSNLWPTDCQRERILEDSQSPSPCSTCTTSSGESSSSSTHQNPTYVPDFTEQKNYNQTPRPKYLGPPGQAFPQTTDLGKFGGSTPDLNSGSPFYKAPSYSSNNSNNVGVSGDDTPSTSSSVNQSIPPPMYDPPAPGMYDNAAYYGLSDSEDDTATFESETGESYKNSLPGQPRQVQASAWVQESTPYNANQRHIPV